jgi:chromosomal replication initiator protein
MQAAGHLVKEKDPKAKIIYMPLMDFVRNITTSLRHNTIEDIKSFYQSADLLLVDDIHLIAGKEKSQEEFFHIFNFLFNTKKQIIFTCDQPPKNIKSLEERLKTRFSQGLNLLLKPPELEMRAAILLKKAACGLIKSPSAVSITSLVIIRLGSLEKSMKALSFNKAPSKSRTFESIFRKQHTVLARQMAIFIAHELTNLSLANIGKHFGNRDHSTVLHAIKKIKLKIEETETKSNYEVVKLLVYFQQHR